MKEMLILGGNSRLAKAYKTLYSDQSILLPKAKCDITNPDSIKQTLKKSPAPYVLNCAALTDIELCESNPLSCFEINAIAVKNLQKLCQKYNKKLIHISSDYALRPKNIYGWSKYLSEKLLHKNTLIIRTNFYDLDTYIIERLLQNKPVDAYTNTYCNPISIQHLIKEIYSRKKETGLINIFTKEKITWYQFAQKVCAAFGLDPQKLVHKAIFRNQKEKAKRPLSSYVKPDITISIDDDLKTFKQYIAQ